MESDGIDSVMSVPAKIGVLVAVAVALGKVAVCVPVPIETKAADGPSFIIRTTLPLAGNAADVLADEVTETGSVRAWALKGCTFIVLSSLN